MKTHYIFSIIALSALLASCNGIDPAIAEFNAKRHLVSLGDNKNKVLTVLLPTQRGIDSGATKPPEAYINANGETVEIYFFRSGRQPDGLTTDDEFTPYAFTDGVLTAIGWSSLGGPKSRGQVIQPAPQINNTNTTNVRVIN